MENDDQNQKEIALTRKIEALGGKYDPTSNFPIEDQLLICETLVESTPIPPDYIQQKESTNENGSVNGNGNGSDNGSCKRKVNFELNESKLRAISKLNKYYLTSATEISEQLEILFKEYPSNPGHWLYIVQHHTLRQINWSLRYMLKLNESGRIRKTPAACFTNDIKYRGQKKEIRKQKKRNDLSIPMVSTNSKYEN